MDHPTSSVRRLIACCLGLLLAMFARPVSALAAPASDALSAAVATADGNETRTGILQAQKIDFTPSSLVIDGKDYEISDDFESSLSDVVSWLLRSHSVPVEYTLNGREEIVSIRKVSAASASRVTAAKAKKAATPTGQTASQASVELQRLARKGTVGLDANLNAYFTSAQVAEIRDFLQVWTSLIVTSQDVDSPDLGEKVTKKILSKLGVSIDTFLFMKDTNGSVEVKAETVDGDDATIEFSLSIDSYTLDKGQSPFASLGKLSYEIKGCSSTEGYPTTGGGVVTFADMEAFCTQVSSIANSAIKGAYDSIWGKSANKVASLFVEAPFDKLLKGKFSNKVYELITAPTTNHLKEVRAKCPVDVFVYDSSGDLVGSVENNVVTNDEGVLIYVVGDEKRVFLEGDDYVLKLVGTGAGTMEYEIVEYVDDAEVRTVVTPRAPLEGMTYYAVVPDASYCDNASYPLCDADGDEVPLGSDSYQSLDEHDPYDDILTGQCGEDVTWLLYQGSLVIRGTGNMYESANEDYPLRADDWGWHEHRASISRIVVEDGVTSIGDEAFAGCESLTQVELPQSLSRIGYRAFADCSQLAQVELPRAGCELDAYVFSGCTSLRELSVPHGVKPTSEVETAVGGTMYKGKLVRVASFGPFAESSIERFDVEDMETLPAAIFQGCQTVREVSLPDKLQVIEEYAFAGCRSLERLFIPDGVTTIGVNVFYFCDGLTDLTVPSSVTELDAPFIVGGESIADGDIPPYSEDLVIHGYENSYFYVWMNYANGGVSTGLGRVPGTFDAIGRVEPFTFEEGAYGDNISWSFDSSLTLRVSGQGDMEDADRSQTHSINSLNYPWGKYRNITKALELGEGILSTGEGAFSHFDSIEALSLPNSLVILGNNAFTYCDSLKQVRVGSGTTEIGGLAFGDCPSLESISLPEGLTNIEFKAFLDCTSLVDVYYEGNEQSWSQIDISEHNDSLLSANIHFGSSGGAGEVDPDPDPDPGDGDHGDEDDPSHGGDGPDEPEQGGGQGSPSTPPAQPTYPPSVTEAEGGTVDVSPRRPHAGDDVTLTPKPEEGQEVREVVVRDGDGELVDLVDNGDGTWSFEQPDGSVGIDVTFGCDGGALCATHRFADVDQGEWYHDAIDWAIGSGAMNGYDSGDFGPNDVLSRSQMACVLHNLAGQPDASLDQLLPDCEAGSWYASGVAWALQTGVFHGNGNGTFSPDEGISREQVACVLYNAAAVLGEDVSARADLSSYGDAEAVSDYAEEAMSWAVATGVISGRENAETGELSLAPVERCTRAEVAAVLMNLSLAGGRAA